MARMALRRPGGLRRGIETHYAQPAAGRPAQCPLRPVHIADGLMKDDKPGRGTERRGRERFTAGSPEAGAARKSQAAKVAGARPKRSRASSEDADASLDDASGEKPGQ